MSPYLLLAMASALTVIFLNDVQHTHGYYFLAMLNGGFYGLLCVAILWAHLRENYPQKPRYPKCLHQKAFVWLALILLTTAVATRGVAALEGITIGIQDSLFRPSLMSQE